MVVVVQVKEVVVRVKMGKAFVINQRTSNDMITFMGLPFWMTEKLDWTPFW